MIVLAFDDSSTLGVWPMSHHGYPSIEDLRALAILSRTESVTKAARELGVSQPSLSRRLAAFRENWPLITTQGKIVKLTERGRTVLPAIEQVLRQYDHICQYLVDRTECPRTLRLATGSVASQWYVARAIASFLERCDDCQIVTRVVRGESRITGTADGAYDLAVVSHDPMRIENAVRQRCGRDFNLSVVEIANHVMVVTARIGTADGARLEAILAAHDVPLAMLAELELLGLDRQSGIRRRLEGTLRNEGISVSFRSEVGGWLALKEFTKRGVGSAVFPLAVLSREDEKELVIRRISELSVKHYLIYRSDDDRPELGELRESVIVAARAHAKEVNRVWKGSLL